MEYLNELVQLARRQSPYFADHLQSVGNVTRLEEIPITDHVKFWNAANKDRRSIMTGLQIDGVLTRTGGTTNRPKITSYSQIEWQRAAHLLGLGLLDAGLQAGDRIANLFYCGDLYASFLFEVLSVLSLPIAAITVPIGSASSPSLICDHIEQCNVNVLLGPPTVLVTLAEYCLENNRSFHQVHAIMYGGEGLFQRQKAYLKQAFPKATIKPCVYATADGGMIASCASTLEDDDHRLLKVFKSAVMMEIVTEDDRQAIIRDNHAPGTIVVTNLSRQLQPVIRYPTGDRAEWIDYQTGIFQHLGRSNTAIRLGSVSIDMEDIRYIVGEVIPSFAAVQAVIRQTAESRDQLECVIAASPAHPDQACAEIVSLFAAERPMYAQHVSNGWIAPMKVRFAPMSELRTAISSRKLVEVVDLRFETKSQRCHDAES